MMKKIIRHITLIVALLGGILMPCDINASGSPQAIEASATGVKVSGHQLVISVSDNNTHQVMIYALTGQLVKQLSAEYGTTTVDLTPGYYIVKIDRNSTRIVVR